MSDTRQALMLRQYGQHDWLENVAGDADSVADGYHCDPLQLLVKREEEDGVVDPQPQPKPKLTLKGKPMSTETIQDQLAPLVTARFVPVDYIGEHLQHQHLRFSLMSNMAWSIDQSIVSAATGLFFDVRRENPQIGGDIGLLIDAFRGTYDNESYWGEGNAKLLVQLLRQQHEVHQHAYRCASAIGRDNFRPKSLVELVTGQTAFDINAQEAANIDQVAKFLAEQQTGDDADKLSADEIAKNMRSGIVQRNENAAKMRRQILPATQVFVEIARKYALAAGHMIADDDGNLHPADADFHLLPTQQQLFVVRNLRKACTRSLTDWVRLDTVSYGMLIVEAHAAGKQLDRVIDKLTRELERERGEV